METRFGSALSGVGDSPGTSDRSDVVAAGTSMPFRSARIISLPRAYHNVSRYIIASISLFACVVGTWSAGRAGVSHLFSDQAMAHGRSGLAAQAVRFNPSDPQARYAHAAALLQAGQLADATREFEKAVALRPSDYLLWLDLGSAREQISDREGALAALKEAARLAPYYARPRWDSGQLLLRLGRRDEAFDALRRAVASRPALLPDVIGLAWKTYGGDVAAVQRAIQPQTSQERILLARFIASHGRMEEAMQLFRLAGEMPDTTRLAFLSDLLDAKRFKEAYEIWSSGRKQTNPGGGLEAITDGSFENEIDPDDPGFGWQLAQRVAAISVSLDTDEPRAGAHSLLLRFGGDAQASTRILKQIVLVSPGTHYRLGFAARTEKLVTGGPPLVFVTDAASNDGNALAQSMPLAIGTVGWRDYIVEFTTPDTTDAVVIGVQRQNCASEQCPIFGSIWFDAFSLQKL